MIYYLINNLKRILGDETIKDKKRFIVTTLLIMTILLTACTQTNAPGKSTSSVKSTGQIYLYGEQHNVEKILAKELDLWKAYYNEQNMRHLFIESSYYGAEFLNLWMASDNDDILEELYDDWEGTLSHSPYVKDFYKKIKRQCPETIFHGTDIGHQYDTTGKRFLSYLKENNLQATEGYLLAQEAIQQGKRFYRSSDDVYRENKMVENFSREFDKLKDEHIMGIYGWAHTNFDATDYTTNSAPSMANQLNDRYGDTIYCEDLSWLAKETKPVKVETIVVDGKDYKASYFGKEDLKGFKGYSSREFWRLENAYEDLKDKKKVGDALPYDNYPMLIEIEQVFLIDYTKTEGTVERRYYRSDGNTQNGKLSTEEFN